MNKRFILTIDEGTSKCKTALWDSEGKMFGFTAREIPSTYPRPGEMEQDPMTIIDAVKICTRETLAKSGHGIEEVEGIGITNQRETTVMWDRRTGAPIYNAIVWQDRRGEIAIRKLDKEESTFIKNVSGLIPDPYFSVSKIKWILDNRLKSRNIENVAFGTVDSWLIWNLSSNHVHISDSSNASRTMIYDIRHNEWSQELLNLFHVPESILPNIVDSASPELATISEFGTEIPLRSIAGDQQASLFGHGAFNPGEVKCTYGTGSFVLMNSGHKIDMKQNLLTSVGWKFEGDSSEFCVEGSVFNTGSVVQWIRDGLKLIGTIGESEDAARMAPRDHGLIFVPALAGLGAPFWHPSAKGTIFGITAKTTPRDIIRSALESIAFRIRDIYEEMTLDKGRTIDGLRVDGGPTMNNFLMQFQADILGLKIYRSENSEITSAGVAFMAGIVSDWWSRKEVNELKKYEKPFVPEITSEYADKLYSTWRKSIKSVINHY
ncbi:MAG: glycerol kinase GlpK [Thermoplasmataceae archaeon]